VRRFESLALCTRPRHSDRHPGRASGTLAAAGPAANRGRPPLPRHPSPRRWHDHSSRQGFLEMLGVFAEFKTNLRRERQMHERIAGTSIVD